MMIAYRYLFLDDTLGYMQIITKRAELAIFGFPLITLLPFSTNSYGNLENVWCTIPINTVAGQVWIFFAYFIWIYFALIFCICCLIDTVRKVSKFYPEMGLKILKTIGLYAVFATVTWLPRCTARAYYIEYQISSIFIYISGLLYFFLFLTEKQSLKLFETVFKQSDMRSDSVCSEFSVGSNYSWDRDLDNLPISKIGKQDDGLLSLGATSRASSLKKKLELQLANIVSDQSTNSSAPNSLTYSNSSHSAFSNSSNMNSGLVGDSLTGVVSNSISSSINQQPDSGTHGVTTDGGYVSVGYVSPTPNSASNNNSNFSSANNSQNNSRASTPTRAAAEHGCANANNSGADLQFSGSSSQSSTPLRVNNKDKFTGSNTASIQQNKAKNPESVHKHDTMGLEGGKPSGISAGNKAINSSKALMEQADSVTEEVINPLSQYSEDKK